MADVGHVIVAKCQTAGRGRFGRSWISPSGGLYATFIVEWAPIPSIRAGFAVLSSLAALGIAAELKWPNDVLVKGKKIAGILIETAEDRLLVGVGVNLDGSPLETATSVGDEGVGIDPESLLQEIRSRLGDRRADGEVMDAYRRTCRTIGKAVRVTFVDGRLPLEGIATDVDAVGRLVVAGPLGAQTISSGDCQHLESETGVVDR